MPEVVVTGVIVVPSGGAGMPLLQTLSPVRSTLPVLTICV